MYGLGWHSWYSNSLQAGWSGDQILVGLRFFAPVQTSSGGLPSLLYSGCWVSFQGVKWLGCGVDNQLLSSVEVKE